MSGVSSGALRDLREGKVSFDSWDGLNEHEKLAAHAFEEGLENSFLDYPPTLHVEPEFADDGTPIDFALIISFGRSLGNNDGPNWQFSLKDALSNFGDISEEERLYFERVLMALLVHVRAEIKTPRVDGPRRESRVIGEDGKDVPQSPSKQFYDALAAHAAPKIYEILRHAIETDEPVKPAALDDIMKDFKFPKLRYPG